jgi:hypothetical protein
VQDLDHHIADSNVLLVTQGLEGELHPFGVTFMKTVQGPGFLGQGVRAGVVIGMDMGVEYMGDTDILLSGFLHEPVFVTQNRIDGDTDMAATAAKKVGKGGLSGRELAKEHKDLLNGFLLLAPLKRVGAASSAT